MKNKITLLCCAGVLSGCIGHDTGTVDLQQFIVDEREKTPPSIPDVPTFNTIPQFPYEHNDRRDPFDTSRRDEGVDVRPDIIGGSIPLSVLNHPPEELENFSLDSLSMQGTLQLKGIQWVLLKDPDDTLHRVKLGNYLGKHFGRIIDISEEKIKISEYYEGQNGYEARQSEVVLEGL